MSYYDDLWYLSVTSPTDVIQFVLEFSSASLVVIFCRMGGAYIGFDILAVVIQ